MDIILYEYLYALYKMHEIYVFTLSMYQNPCPQIKYTHQRYIKEVNEFVEMGHRFRYVGQDIQLNLVCFFHIPRKKSSD